jgi:hypothetical protein
LKQVTKCLRRRLAWCNKTGERYDSSLEQYSPWPRALCDCNSIPNKGSKSNWTAKLRQRYTKEFLEDLHITPDVAVVDAMFILNTNPRRQAKTIGGYGDQLCERYITPYFRRGAAEVHLVFDCPNSTVKQQSIQREIRTAP